jgi:hypothetical protein
MAPKSGVFSDIWACLVAIGCIKAGKEKALLFLGKRKQKDFLIPPRSPEIPGLGA